VEVYVDVEKRDYFVVNGGSVVVVELRHRLLFVWVVWFV